MPFNDLIRAGVSRPSLVETRLFGSNLIRAYLIRANLIKQGWKIVIECPGSCVIGVDETVGSGVARAKIAVRIIAYACRLGYVGLIPMPRTFCPLRRHGDPLAGQCIFAPVR